jgi:hypothetical protein
MKTVYSATNISGPVTNFISVMLSHRSLKLSFMKSLFEIDSKGFCRWRLKLSCFWTLSIVQCFLKTQRFGNCICFRLPTN